MPPVTERDPCAKHRRHGVAGAGMLTKMSSERPLRLDIAIRVPARTKNELPQHHVRTPNQQKLL